MSTKHPRITMESFKRAASGSWGIQTLIADRLGVTRAAVNKFVKRHSELENILKDEREKMIDLAERELTKKLESGEMEAIKLTLKGIGKSRGHNEKQEVEHSGQTQSKLEVVIIDGNEDGSSNEGSA